MTKPVVLVESSNGIGRITFIRPRQLNAFNNELMTATIAAVG